MSIKKTTDDWKLVQAGQQENLNLANQYLESAAESSDPLQIGVAETQRASQAQTVATVDQQVQLAERGEPGTQTNSPPTSVEVTPITRDTIPRRDELIVETTIQIPGGPTLNVNSIRQPQIQSEEATETPPIPREQADLGELGINTDLPASAGIQAVPRSLPSTDIPVSAPSIPSATNILSIEEDAAAPSGIQAVPRPQQNTEVSASDGLIFRSSLQAPAPIEARTSPDDPRDSVPITSAPDTDDALSITIQEALARDAARANTTASTTRSTRSTGRVRGTEQAQKSQVITNNQKDVDWRFRISLRKGSKYLYNDPNIERDTKALLYPLIATDGVIFPFTPKIDLTYNANYESVDPIHSNYKFYNYKNSSIEQISISGDFIAQDTYEANYLLAVIHFFKSVTKMFYGKDQSPNLGVPPPLCYLTGHGTYAFNYHPCVITSFSLNYPTDVDYVNAKIPIGNLQGAPIFDKPTVGPPTRWQRYQRLVSSGIQSGGYRADPVNNNPITNNSELTRVPSKMTITLSALPVVTRNDVSNNFSLRDYATGKLMLSNRKSSGSRPTFGGIW